MVLRSKEIKGNELYNLHGGKGKMTMFGLLMGREKLRNHGNVFSYSELEEGGAIGFHEHYNEFECYYIIEGEGIYNDNGVEIPVKAGDMTLCPDRESHGIINTGKGPLKMMNLVLYS